MPRRPAPRRPAPRPTTSAGVVLPPVALGHPAFLLALAVTAACLVIGVSTLISEADVWEHLAVGREIVRLGRVPTTEVWTWPTYGHPEATPSWIFRVLLFGLYKAWGTAGIYLMRWSTTLLAFGLAWWTGRRMGARGLSALVVVAWAALFYRVRAQARPETLSFVLLALQLLLHETVRRLPADRSPWKSVALALPLVALVWANAHISYWIGLLLQAIYFVQAWIDSRREPARGRWLLPLVILGLVSGAISFVNPGGWRPLAQPFQFWLTWRHELIYQQIGELEAIHWDQNLRNLLWLFVGGWPLLILLRIRKHGVDFVEAALAGIFLFLTLGSMRFLANLAVVAVPFVSRDLAEHFEGARAPRALASPWARAALVAALCVGGSLAEWASPAVPSGVGFSPFWRPLAACDFIERTGIRGRSFNSNEFGGYFLWRFPGQHDRLPFMDIHDTGTTEDRRLYAQSLTDLDAWRRLDAKYRFDWVLFTRFMMGGDRSCDHLDADSTWALVFLDDVAAVYVRRSGPLRPVAERYEYRVLRGGFGAAGEIAAAFADSARRPAVRAELRRLERESPVHATALSWEANILFREGRLAEARDTLRTALAIDRYYPQANARLAEVALALGRAREAEEAARLALVVDGRNERTEQALYRAKAMRREGGPLVNASEPLPRVPLPYGWPRAE